MNAEKIMYVFHKLWREGKRWMRWQIMKIVKPKCWLNESMQKCKSVKWNVDLGIEWHVCLDTNSSSSRIQAIFFFCILFVFYFPLHLTHLQQSQLIWLASAGILVPAAIRIGHTAETRVVAAGAHRQIDLLYTMLQSQVQRARFLTQTHLAYRLIVGYLQYVEQVREALTVAYELNDFVNESGAGADEIY